MDAKKMAEHHQTHLYEFAKKENLTLKTSGLEMINEDHFIAFLLVSKNEMIQVRDALIPHRGEIIDD